METATTAKLEPQRKGANQWTKRRAQKTAREYADKWQQNPRYGVARLMQLLADNWEGKIELSQQQIKSIEIALDRVAPRLSAVEQTNVEAAQEASEADLLATIRAITRQYPDLIQQLLAEQARDKPGLAVAVENVQSQQSSDSAKSASA